MATQKNRSNGESKVTWKDPKLPTQKVEQTLKDGTKRTITKRVCPPIDGMALVTACLAAKSIQGAIDATGLPIDVIDQRLGVYARKMRKEGFPFDPAKQFAWLAQYHQATRKGRGGSGRAPTDLAAMAALLGLKKVEAKKAE